MLVAMEYRRGAFSDKSAEWLVAARRFFQYLPGEIRATGRIVGAPFEVLGANHAVFQAYKDGTAACDWHADDYHQVIVSLGATRTMGVRLDSGEQTFPVADGDVLSIAAGIEHAVLPDPEETGERISLVFRFLKGQP